jgi:putative restriction endonuclease
MLRSEEANMAFWLVYQGTSWERARAGGYLWAPKLSKSGQTPVHWSNMERVRAGELIFSGVNNALRAVSQAVLPAYTASRPDPRDDEHWDGEGWRLDVAYSDLPKPLSYPDWVPAVLPQMQARYGAFARSGRPNQGYLFELPLSVGEFLIAKIQAQGVDIAAKASDAAPMLAGSETERYALARARVGQGKFRQDLLTRFNCKCAVSGVERAELLRASHIKPWAGSSNVERLDPNNGLLLSAAYDAAFDARLISFADDGSLLLAPDFPPETARKAGIDPLARLLTNDGASTSYLAQHRELMSAQSRSRALGANY